VEHVRFRGTALVKVGQVKASERRTISKEVTPTIFNGSKPQKTYQILTGTHCMATDFLHVTGFVLSLTPMSLKGPSRRKKTTPFLLLAWK
jgi:hypothetical protein